MSVSTLESILVHPKKILCESCLTFARQNQVLSDTDLPECDKVKSATNREEVSISALVFQTTKQSISSCEPFHYCRKFWFTPILYMTPKNNTIRKIIKYKFSNLLFLNYQQVRMGGRGGWRNRSYQIFYLPTVPISHNTWQFSTGHSTVPTQPFQDQCCVRGRRAHRAMTNNKISQTLNGQNPASNSCL